MKLSPTLQALYDALIPGEPVHKDELMRCLNDELTDYNTLYVSIHALRKRLSPRGLYIVADESTGQCRYIMLRRLHSSPTE